MKSRNRSDRKSCLHLVLIIRNWSRKYTKLCSRNIFQTFKAKKNNNLQKRFIRLINFVPPLTHTDPLFSQSKLLKWKEIHRYKCAIYMFKNNLQYSFQRSHVYETRNRNLLNPTYQRLNLSQRSISFSGPTVWNSLPAEIKDSGSLESFKRNVKSHLISIQNNV